MSNNEIEIEIDEIKYMDEVIVIASSTTVAAEVGIIGAAFPIKNSDDIYIRDRYQKVWHGPYNRHEIRKITETE